MDNTTVDVIGYVVEGTDQVPFAMQAIRHAQGLAGGSRKSFELQGKQVRVWYREDYRHAHRFSSHQGRACPLGRGRAG